MRNDKQNWVNKLLTEENLIVFFFLNDETTST